VKRPDRLGRRGNRIKIREIAGYRCAEGTYFAAGCPGIRDGPREPVNLRAVGGECAHRFESDPGVASGHHEALSREIDAGKHLVRRRTCAKWI
jgi:hypothetical protein